MYKIIGFPYRGACANQTKDFHDLGSFRLRHVLHDAQEAHDAE